MTKKKICIAMAGVVAVLAAALCACTIVPANGEYDITQGVTGSRGELTFTLASYNVHGGADAIVSCVKARLANETGNQII